jgi:hypothetical protein
MEPESDARNLLSQLGVKEQAKIMSEALGARFRDALRKANPEMTDDHAAFYDQEFASEIDTLAEAAFEAQIKDIESRLSEQDRATLRKMVEDPLFSEYTRFIKESLTSSEDAMRGFLQTEVVAAHTRTTQKLFATI